MSSTSSITKALLDRIKISPGELKSPEGYEQLPHALWAWHANIVSIDRRKTSSILDIELYQLKIRIEIEGFDI